MKNIIESLDISKTFTLNMEEIDYGILIEFLQDMKDKNEKLIKIRIKQDSSGKRKWVGFSTGKDGEGIYNLTNLSLYGNYIISYT